MWTNAVSLTGMDMIQLLAAFIEFFTIDLLISSSITETIIVYLQEMQDITPVF